MKPIWSEIRGHFKNRLFWRFSKQCPVLPYHNFVAHFNKSVVHDHSRRCCFSLYSLDVISGSTWHFSLPIWGPAYQSFWEQKNPRRAIPCYYISAMAQIQLVIFPFPHLTKYQIRAMYQRDFLKYECHKKYWFLRWDKPTRK